MPTLLAALSLALALNSSAGVGMRATGPKGAVGGSIGKCTTGAHIELASNHCALAYYRKDYAGWGRNTSAYYEDAYNRDTAQQITPDDGDAVTLVNKKGKEVAKKTFEVMDVDPIAHKVQIKFRGGDPSSPTLLWVNADNLLCEPNRNVRSYNGDVGVSDPSSCPTGAVVPLSDAELRKLSDAANAEMHKAVLDKAIAYKKKVDAETKNDNVALLKAFWSDKISTEQRRAMLIRARDRLKRLAGHLTNVYGPDCENEEFNDPRNPYAKERGARACRTMRDAVKTLGYLNLDDADHSAGEYAQALQGLSVLADTSIGKSTNTDLTTRTIYYYALGLETPDPGTDPNAVSSEDPPGTDKGYLRKLKAKLKLVNRNSQDLIQVERASKKGGTKPPKNMDGRPVKTDLGFDELHNGYLYGAQGEGSSAIECAGFVLHHVMGIRGDKTPTVQDFENLHRYLSDDPAMKSVPFFQQYSSCFQVIDLRKNETPMAGDLVSSAGHIVIASGYDSDTHEIKTIEAASGGCGSVCEMRRPIVEESCEGQHPFDSKNWGLRPIRSDIRVLRFAPRAGAELRPGESPCPIDTKTLGR
ncbi:MAG: hypothetical protein HY074_18425 [Deltaproteobacteria bacterium]|nr:hypothetical protein [Deltaproteobacteria bacterium]